MGPVGAGGRANETGQGGTAGEGGTPSITGGAAGTASALSEAGAVADEGGAKMEGGAPSGKVPVFIAQGHLGRTTISCDDGRTWIHNHSVDDTQRCFEGTLDCDHSADAGRGITYGNGWFVLTWGWGHPGTVQRSSDGVTWETVMMNSPTFADLAFGNGTFVADASPTKVSTDAKTWATGGPLGFSINYRSIDFIDHDGGRFIVTGESGDQRAIAISKDGKTWQMATDRPADCGSYYRGLAYGGGTAVLASGNGHVCYSKDGGDTWKLVKLDTALGPAVLWADTEFMVYNGSKRYHSADGVTWQNDTTVPANIQIGAAARSPDGTFVAANDGWLVWYEKQKFFRSTDGKTWEVLPAASFVGSHPINFMSFGYVDPGAGCPAK